MRFTEITEGAAAAAADKKARLAQLKADYAELPKNPGNQEGYDALDELRDKIKQAEKELGVVSEAHSQNAVTSFNHHKMRAQVALGALVDAVEKFSRSQTKNPHDWGYAGSMEYLADQLEELFSSFGEK